MDKTKPNSKAGTAVLLLMAMAAGFLWTQSYLMTFSAELLIILAAGFLIYRHIFNVSFTHPANLVILTTIILILISQTGGLDSPLFFLIYLFIFGVALLFSTSLVLLLTLATILFFAPSLQNTHAAFQLSSLLLITPLAIFFGRQYLQSLEKEGEIVFLKKQKKQVERDLTQQESSSLLWLSLNLKKTLADINENIARLLADISHLTPRQRRILQSTRQKIQTIYQESEKVQEIIDKQTDEE